MKEFLKIISTLWNEISPQKSLDMHYNKIRRDKYSKKLKERLVTTITWNKIVYGYLELLIVMGLLVLAGIYLTHKP